MPLTTRVLASGALAFGLALSPLAGALSAQGTARTAIRPTVSTAVAASFDERAEEVAALAPVGRGAEVTNLVLRRDVAELSLAQGRVNLLSPVGGRTVGFVFKGEGTFRFTAPAGMEHDRLAKRYPGGKVEQRFTELVVLFSDRTLDELGRNAPLGAVGALGMTGRVREFLDYLSEDEKNTLDVDLMGSFLNGEDDGLFYAQMNGGGDPITLLINPHQVEGVRLLNRARRTGWVRVNESTVQLRRLGDSLGVVHAERLRQTEVQSYRIAATLPRSGIGDLGFQADARMEITADQPVGPWVAFSLYSKLQVDSARWEDGTAGVPATVAKRPNSSALWVRLDAPLAAGATRTLRIWYRGDLIDRYADFFFIKGSTAWYPRSIEGRDLASFDLTFRTPKSLLFASVGERTDSSVADGWMTTRWVTRSPIRNASFNVGMFKEHRVDLEGAPPISVYYAEQAHRNWIAKASSKERVGEDVANSMKFFGHVFGGMPAQRFYATEIPYSHGEAFPGLVHLSASTFLGGGPDQGFDEFFRAHEVAHQWWGIGVDFATYHDQWLSEGMSSFAGLWYLQVARKDNKKYFDMLDRWRTDIMLRRKEAEPVALGYRTASASDGRDYQVLVYEKGAWVMHMLRIMMLDLKTMNEDRFTRMMRDFYAQHQGKRATTDDLRRTAERHIGVDMGWYFDQWITGGAIPTYQVATRIEPAESGQYRVRLRVRQSEVPASFRAYVPVTVQLGKESVARVRVKIEGAQSDVELPLMPSKPTDVRFNDMSGVLADVKSVAWTD